MAAVWQTSWPAPACSEPGISPAIAIWMTRASKRRASRAILKTSNISFESMIVSSHSLDQPAIHRERFTSNKTRGIAHQKERHLGNVLGCANTPQGRVSGERGANVVAFDQGFVNHLGVDHPWAEG